MKLFNKKPKRITKRFIIDDDLLQRYSQPARKTYPSLYFDRFIKPCCPDFDRVYKEENRKGRFLGIAYLYEGLGYKSHRRSCEFDNLYDAYYYARFQAYKIDKETYSSRFRDMGVEYTVHILIEVDV
jgi:hypothetical protein